MDHNDLMILKVYSLPENDDEAKNILPVVKIGDKVKIKDIDEQHFTNPPPRYSEASLVKKLEELGIGRPLRTRYNSVLSTKIMLNY